MKRPDFMALALKEAEAAASRGEVPVGAVIANGNIVVAK
ncbi:MAG: nucleoside deaminase, partial [Mesorhizobium sp.]